MSEKPENTADFDGTAPDPAPAPTTPLEDALPGTTAVSQDPSRDPVATDPGAEDRTAQDTPNPTGGADPAAADPAASTPRSATAPPERPRPRTGPIVWGALVLAFCAYVATSIANNGAVDTRSWIITTVIGLGVLLLGVGVAVLFRSGRRR